MSVLGLSEEMVGFKRKVVEPIKNYDRLDPRSLQDNLRKYGELNIPAAVEYLYGKNLSVLDIMKQLHVAVTPGAKENEWINGQEIPGGEFRGIKVQFGDKIPPTHEDVPEIAGEFAQKLDQLIAQCPADKFEALATWTYVTELSLHPFLDANNRGSWAMAEYVRYVGSKRKGTNYIPLPVPPQNSALKDQIVETELGQLMFDMKLFPNPYYENNGLGGPAIAVVINEEQYFADVRAMQLSAIRDMNIEKLVSDKRLEDFAERMKAMAFSDKYATKPLDAEDMAEKFRQNIKSL